MMKKDKIEIRLTDEEKQNIREVSKAEGFNTMSSFILWVLRKYLTRPDEETNISSHDHRQNPTH